MTGFYNTTEIPAVFREFKLNCNNFPLAYEINVTRVNGDHNRKCKIGYDK